MDWLKTILKAAGLDDAAIDKAVADAGKELPKYFITKDKYNEAIEVKKQAEKDVADRDAQIAELGKAAGASEEMKAQIAKLQGENQTAKEQYEANLKDLTLTGAIKAALAGKVHDEGLVAGLFDRAKLVIDGDKVVGLEDQVKALQESKAFLFKAEDNGGGQGGFRVGAGGSGTGKAGAEQLASIFGVAETK